MPVFSEISCLAGQIAVNILCVLQNGNQAALDGSVLGENAVEKGQINCFFIHLQTSIPKFHNYSYYTVFMR